MSKQRIVNDTFWSDPFIQDLEPNEKLLFLYLITNPHGNIAGIYEITEKQILFETGLTKNILSQAVQRLSENGKILYENNWVVVKNFIKNQSRNPSVEKGVNRVLESIPDWVSDRLCTGCTPPLTYLTLLNLTLLNLTEEKKILKKEKPQLSFQNETSSPSRESVKPKVSEKNEYTDDFLEFWREYPRKDAKRKSMQIWKKQKLKDKLQEILSALSWQKNLPSWQSDGGKYIPQASTYLNQSRWEDERPVPVVKVYDWDNITIDEAVEIIKNGTPKQKEDLEFNATATFLKAYRQC